MPTIEAQASTAADAVEVVAMLGDSVVGVKHCIDPGGGKVRPMTWAIVAASMVTLATFGIAFWTALDIAADNQQRYQQETAVLGKPRFAVRLQPLPARYEWLTFGGLFVSIVTCATALARMSEERRSSFVRIGTAPGVEFPVADAPAPDFAMVAPHADAFAFRFADGMDGELLVGGEATSLAALAKQGRTTISPIPTGATIRVHVGTTTFLVSSIARPRRHAMPLVGVDGGFARSLAGTAVVFGILVLLLLRIPVDAGATSVDVAALEDARTRCTITDHDDAPWLGEPLGAENESGVTGRSMALDAGAMGRKDSPRAEGTYQLVEQQQDPQLARQQAIEQARSAGILGSSALGRDAFASLTGTAELSSDFDDATSYGGLIGSEPGELTGGFGFARSDFGPGGGGTGWGTICGESPGATGCRYGTIGHGSGTGEGYGIGGGRCGLCRGRVAATPSVSIGQPVALGDLDKAIVRRYLRRNIDKITYCYEKQLLAKPELSGTVSTQFFITPAGKVSSATAEGVDRDVASCVADVISDIQFPKSANGGSVQVSYPFIFRSAGR